MIQFISKNKLVFLGIILGAIAGYLYWKYVGCITGSCAITSNPISSTIYGSVSGGLIFSLFIPNKKRKIK